MIYCRVYMFEHGTMPFNISEVGFSGNWALHIMQHNDK